MPPPERVIPAIIAAQAAVVPLPVDPPMIALPAADEHRAGQGEEHRDVLLALEEAEDECEDRDPGIEHLSRTRCARREAVSLERQDHVLDEDRPP